jgi:hypothetical protein
MNLTCNRWSPRIRWKSFLVRFSGLSLEWHLWFLNGKEYDIEGTGTSTTNDMVVFVGLSS